MKKGNNKLVIWIIVLLAFYLIFISDRNSNSNHYDDEAFHILASTSVSKMDDDLIKYGKKQGIDVIIEHYGDLEIVDMLNEDAKKYDAVWMSNSLWLYMLNNPNLTTDSKSIAISPVVMGIKKSKAKELGFTSKEITNKDILNSIKSGQLKYIMSSVTKTNTGAITYLNFLNTLSGSPPLLTEEMLDNESLKSDLKSFFKGVSRVSGNETELAQYFNSGEYDALIDYESSLIDMNKALSASGKETLYLIYPTDGIALNDLPFAYVNNDATDTENKEAFITLQNYLRSEDTLNKMSSLGLRSWYGGINNNPDKSVFNPEWGIDTTKYLRDMALPSKGVITKAINMYIDVLRKPNHTVFLLDVSGSMYGDGLDELSEAMYYILDREKASIEKLQFSNSDKITIITFNEKVSKIYDTKNGSETEDVIKIINELDANGGTNIYEPSIAGLKILKDVDENEYTRTIILMTDGNSNNGKFSNLANYYRTNKLNIPIYSITFGDSNEKQLNEIAKLTNAKIFDGKNGLLKAFREVRSYN